MSEVQICNQALSLVGAQAITSLDDDTNEARLCRINYESVRDAVLTEHDWTFATRWETFPAENNPPPGEFANSFVIPTDVLAILFVGQDYDHPEQYRVEDGRIRTDAMECKCQVLYQVADTSKFSALFTQAFVARLASELAIPITNSRTLMENMYAMYGQKMSLAASRDGQQGSGRRVRSKWLTRARTRYGYAGVGPYV